MGENNRSNQQLAPSLSRRSVLRTSGTTLAAGTALAGLTGSAQADHCPDPDSDEDYWSCDDPSDEFVHEASYGNDHDRIEGQTSLAIGLKDVQRDNCSGCVYYYFDFVAVHEAEETPDDDEDGPGQCLDRWGIQWDASDAVITADAQPEGSRNIHSGITQTKDEESPYSDEEEALYALADVAVAGGTVLFPALGPYAFLYTLMRASDMDYEVSDNEIRWGDGNGFAKSASVGYYNLRFQVHEDYCANIEFEAFSDYNMGHTHRHSVTTKTFDLDYHTSCNSF